MIRPRPVDPTNTEEPPVCSRECKYRQQFKGYDLQRNALRTETVSMVHPWRCGWNLRPGHIGGHPLDYAECIFKE